MSCPARRRFSAGEDGCAALRRVPMIFGCKFSMLRLPENGRILVRPGAILKPQNRKPPRRLSVRHRLGLRHRHGAWHHRRAEGLGPHGPPRIGDQGDGPEPAAAECLHRPLSPLLKIRGIRVDPWLLFFAFCAFLPNFALTSALPLRLPCPEPAVEGCCPRRLCVILFSTDFNLRNLCICGCLFLCRFLPLFPSAFSIWLFRLAFAPRLPDKAVAAIA